MYCPSCGTQDAAESNFCKRCGTNLKLLAAALAGQIPAGSDGAAQQEYFRFLRRRRGYLVSGIVVTCTGMGLGLFLGVVGGTEAAAVGLIPMMTGVGLFLSGLVMFNPKHLPVASSPPPTLPNQPAFSTPVQSLPGYQESVVSATTKLIEEQQKPERVTK